MSSILARPPVDTMPVQPPNRRLLRSAGAVSILFSLLLFVPVLVLGAAINWPASLDEPASAMIPLIDQQAGAVTVGYLVYLAYSILFFPTVALLAQVLGDTPVTRAAAVFAAISSLARSIGIIRWLSVLPLLAASYLHAPDAAIPVVFDAVNSFGGAVGELLGVSVFAAASLLLLCTAIVRSALLPSWLGLTGYPVVLGLLLPWVELFGMDLGPVISVSSTAVQLWFLAVGVVMLLAPRRRGPALDRAAGSSPVRGDGASR